MAILFSDPALGMAESRALSRQLEFLNKIAHWIFDVAPEKQAPS